METTPPVIEGKVERQGPIVIHAERRKLVDYILYPSKDHHGLDMASQALSNVERMRLR